ncbi:MAG: putative metalloprotease [Alteromonadaceae bacterium]|jgi:predicted metalloprotease
MYFGVVPKIIMSLIDGTLLTQTSSQTNYNYKPSAEQQQLVQFTAVVLADTEDTWQQLFQQMGKRYHVSIIY